MNCEFQIVYEHAGRVETALVVARDRAAALTRIAECGVRSAGLNVAFVRFVPNGLPGDGLDLDQFADYLGASSKTARRMLSKVSHVRCGSRVSITVPALEEFERNYSLKSGGRERRNTRCRSASVSADFADGRRF